MSHWPLDWITHRPDMPLYPGSPRDGLGCWNFITGTFAVELAMFAFGVWMHARVTKANGRVGRCGFAASILLLTAIYVADPFSGPPDNVKDLIWSAAIDVPLLLAWAWWFDSRRILCSVSNERPAPKAATASEERATLCSPDAPTSFRVSAHQNSHFGPRSPA